MNLAYIDDTVNKAIEREAECPTISAAQSKEARLKARKAIAGFHIHDEAAEQKTLDDMIAVRRKVLEQFRTDREEIRTKLGDVKPLAILPTTTWNALCQQAKLIRLAPNSSGQVVVDRDKIASYGNVYRLEQKATKDWDGLMWDFFPGGIERPYNPHWPAFATLVMPEPPADVAATLLKVQHLNLKMATVPGAIGFKETMAEIYKGSVAAIEAEIAYREWLRTDPIVYTEHGTATAVIAQFGDFPIEKELVDRVVASDKLIPEKPVDLATSQGLYGGQGFYRVGIGSALQYNIPGGAGGNELGAGIPVTLVPNPNRYF